MSDRPAVINVKMVVLWADELRIAAKALQRVREFPTDAPDREFDRAIMDAVNACCVALDGAHEDDATLLLSAKPSALVAANQDGQAT